MHTTQSSGVPLGFPCIHERRFCPGKTVKEYYQCWPQNDMATTDVRTMWQRTTLNRFQDDTIRAPKLVHCPNLPKTHPETFHYEMVQSIDQAPSYYWSNSWSSLDTKTAWQMSPSALCVDQRSDCLTLDEFFGSRCPKPTGLQALAAKRTSNAKLSSGMMGITSDYSTGAELELEWQLIVDPKPKSSLSASFRAAEAKKRNEKLKITTLMEGDNVEAISSMNLKNLHKSLMTKTFQESKEVCQGSISEGESENLMIQNCHQFEESSMGEYQETSRKKLCSYDSESFFSTMTSSSISWRIANREALVALVAQKAKEQLENCDLPTPLSRSIILKGPLKSCADSLIPESMESFDRNVMNSILQAGEPIATPTVCLGIYIPASLNVQEKVETSYNSIGQFQARSSLSLTIPTKGQASLAMHRGCQSPSFVDNRQASWMDKEKAMSSCSLSKSSSPLGEALCHSQTRAREAEKRAKESFQDYQKVAHLFFREASLSLTYRQWVGSLQAENARLKMYVHRYQQATVWLQPTGCSPFSVLERFTNCRWNTFCNTFCRDHARRHMQRDHFSLLWPAEKETTASFVISGENGAEIIMGCTLSFAFALGLSLAGAGLMLGWSMGWILLAK